MKKIAWVLIAVAALALLIAPTAAFANNGPHGGYVSDTDMCAACHRAHTAPSSVTWTDNQGGQKNALLLADSSSTYEFCYACHDAGAQGADTNVVDGIYEGTTYGSQDATLLSGPLGREDLTKGTDALYTASGMAVTSSHLINGKSWGAYGGGLYGDPNPANATGNITELIGTGNKIVMDCTTCHDPHGSSNYRLLKDSVNGNAVGGYKYDSTVTGNDPFGNPWSATNPKPTPFVVSDEVGYPQGGFQLHVSYASTYVPDYTKAQYAKSPDGTVDKGMTGWCTGCHTVYKVYSVNSTDPASIYNAGDSFGMVARHRHPMNVSLSAYSGATTLTAPAALAVPLAHDLSEKNPGTVYPANTSSDWIDCMTCHTAHGATTTMSGWADLGAQSTVDVVGSRGVLPTDSNLLRMNNRGVCENCHNK